MHGRNSTKENEEADIGRRHEVQRLIGNSCCKAALRYQSAREAGELGWLVMDTSWKQRSIYVKVEAALHRVGPS